MPPRGGPDASRLGRERGTIVIRRVAEYERKLQRAPKLPKRELARTSRRASFVPELVVPVSMVGYRPLDLAFASSMTAMTASAILPTQSRLCVQIFDNAQDRMARGHARRAPVKDGIFEAKAELGCYIVRLSGGATLERSHPCRSSPGEPR
jgi:hypothetical protein